MLGVMLVLLGFAAGAVKLHKLTRPEPRVEMQAGHPQKPAHTEAAGPSSEATAQRRIRTTRRR
jgi:hypothetical protein